MKFNEMLLDDIGRLASGAASALGGLRGTMDGCRPGPSAGSAVSREEFDVLRAMTAKAREVQDDILRRLAILEAHAGVAGSDQPAGGTATKPGGEDI